MTITRFSDSGKQYLLHQVAQWAKSITAHLLAGMVNITTDRHILAAAIDAFPAIVREQLAELLDDIDSNIQCNGILEEVEDAEQTQFSVTLDGLADPAKKISVIKAVREITFLGLKEAKDLVEGSPKTVKENVSMDEAYELKKKLGEAGGRACVK